MDLVGHETVGLAVDSSGLRLFATHISSQSTSVFDIGNTGTLTPVPGSPFPNPIAGNHPTVVLRGMGMAHLSKNESAIKELTEKGMAPD